MSEPLWSDERITKEARWFIDANCNKRVVAEQAMVKVRDEYEARIAQLEAQLAETWQPVDDGSEFNSGAQRTMSVKVDDGVVFLTLQNDDNTDEVLSFILPADLRLCRKAATVEAE